MNSESPRHGNAVRFAYSGDDDAMAPPMISDGPRSKQAPVAARCMAFALCAFVLVACGAPPVADAQHVPPRTSAAQNSQAQRLRDAMARRDLAAIEALVAEAEHALGARAGEPEIPDRYWPIPRSAPLLTADEAAAMVAPALARMEALRWWRVGLDPTRLGHPLREPADVLIGALALREVSPQNAERALTVAREAGEFLLWAQREAGSGVFPFPASRGASDAAPFRSSARFLERTERQGKLGSVVANGWLIDDLADGGLQFDNSECGVAMLALHRATGDARYLAAARRAADWALARPLATNWNYNSFSVYLLAQTYRATGDARYRDGAWDKARYGVIPGQLRDGRHIGRWFDAHNARPAYHYIMLRALVALAAVLPPSGAERGEVERALRIGLSARNRDFLEPGAPNLDHALQTLTALKSAARDDPAMAGIFKDTQSEQALAALRALGAGSARKGHAQFGPQSFGALLADAARRRAPSP